jgi:pyridoxamine 5'-phosphate oxidase
VALSGRHERSFGVNGAEKATVGPLEQPRVEYRVGMLAETDLAAGPIALARSWVDEAIAAGLPEPTAVTLATVGVDGAPDARMVLLRGLDDAGAVWFTNTSSAKGRQLAAAPHAALVAFWPGFERQLRLRGPVGQVSDAEADAYFASRPRGSQIGAWASAQSEPVADRSVLDAQVAEVDRRFAGRAVPRPPHWTGYRLVPEELEFWQGRPSRLHDRFRARRAGSGWQVVRLQP